MGCGKQECVVEGSLRWSCKPAGLEPVGHTPAGAAVHLPQQVGEGCARRFEMCACRSPTRERRSPAATAVFSRFPRRPNPNPCHLSGNRSTVRDRQPHNAQQGAKRMTGFRTNRRSLLLGLAMAPAIIGRARAAAVKLRLSSLASQRSEIRQRPRLLRQSHQAPEGRQPRRADRGRRSSRTTSSARKSTSSTRSSSASST